MVSSPSRSERNSKIPSFTIHTYTKDSAAAPKAAASSQKGPPRRPVSSRRASHTSTPAAMAATPMRLNPEKKQNRVGASSSRASRSPLHRRQSRA